MVKRFRKGSRMLASFWNSDELTQRAIHDEELGDKNVVVESKFKMVVAHTVTPVCIEALAARVGPSLAWRELSRVVFANASSSVSTKSSTTTATAHVTRIPEHTREASTPLDHPIPAYGATR